MHSSYVRRRTPRRIVVTSWLVVCGAVWLASAVSSQPGASYASLSKPPWIPAAWAFPLVAAAFYVGMAFAAARVSRARHSDAGIAMSFFVVQLGLNGVWLPAFFGSNQLLLPVVAAAMLWLASSATLWLFRQIDARAAALFAPVLAWATFALAASVALWSVN